MISPAGQQQVVAHLEQRGHRFGNIDVLRAVAALMVVAAHANYLSDATREPAGALRHYMWSGVNLFFVLSGYLIARPFLLALYRGTPMPRVGTYALRRAARILPAYWVVLAVSIVILRPFTATWDQVASHLVLVHNSVPGQTFTLVPVAWTLGIEAAFYVMVPLAALAVARRRRGPTRPARLVAIVVGVWILSAAWSLAAAKYGSDWLRTSGDQAVNDAGDSAPAILTVNLPAKLFLFCPGILVALAECTGALRSFSPARTTLGRGLMALAVAGTWWLGVLIDWGHSTPLSRAVRDECFAVAFGVLLVIALRAKPWRSLVARILGAIGMVSYGLYLWHGVAEEWLRDLHLSPPAFGGSMATWLVGTLLVAAAGLLPAGLSWVLLERPILARARRAFPDRAAPARRVPPAPAAITFPASLAPVACVGTAGAALPRPAAQ